MFKIGKMYNGKKRQCRGGVQSSRHMHYKILYRFGLKSVHHVHAGPYPQKTTYSIGNELIWIQTGFMNIGFGTHIDYVPKLFFTISFVIK